jgi:hypothetical protein
MDFEGLDPPVCVPAPPAMSGPETIGHKPPKKAADCKNKMQLWRAKMRCFPPEIKPTLEGIGDKKGVTRCMP